MSAHRVAVTGMGILAANAASAEELGEALAEGRSGIREVRRFDPGFPFRQAGEVELGPAPPGERGLDRVSRLALAAARGAVADAGLEPGGDWAAGTGLCFGTSRGPALSLERLQGLADASERRAALAEVPFYSIARNVARELGLGGGSFTVTMACVSSSLAVGRAFDAVASGRRRVMLAGGGDALTGLSYSGFSLLRAMTRSLCRPFDRRRDGMVLGEGAGVLVLERLDDARRRDARLWGELRGWGSAGDAYHATGPHPEGRGLARAMEAALAAAGATADEIEHVNLHGTGTLMNDRSESRALQSVFGDRRVPVNSLKPMLGHTLGGAGVLELAGTLAGMARGVVAPTLNHGEPDPECAVEVVGGEAREVEQRTVLCSKSAFGGANVAIVAGRA